MSEIKEVVSEVENKDLVKKKHEQIVKAASELFSKQGYHKTTMREISKASGINLSYLYKYISSKDDILFLFSQSLYKKWVQLYEDLDKSTDKNLVEQIDGFLREVLIVNNTLSHEVRTMYTESRHLDKESLRAVLSMESRCIRQIEKVISRGIEQGVFKTEDPFFVANIIQYFATFKTLRGWNFNNQYTFTRYIELLIDFILKALGVEEK
ncbi:TetR/AcrR family transcriptional regulator [Candidatus Falkowbacteria bacterium]|nr:TetR/AcrR family transcriptional regulator [Candidatus Falkowbacteria bacterium]